MLRAVGPDDGDLLWEVFRSSRTGPLAGLPEPMLRQQHQIKEAAYRAAFPGAEDHLIAVSERVVGRLLVWRGPAENRVVDVAIVPAHQGRRIGTLVLLALAEEAAGAGRPLRLTVAVANHGAMRLYRRLGFREVGQDGADVAMELPAGGTRLLAAPPAPEMSRTDAQVERMGLGPSRRIRRGAGGTQGRH